jgi:hypothetical protein
VVENILFKRGYDIRFVTICNWKISFEFGSNSIFRRQLQLQLRETKRQQQQWNLLSSCARLSANFWYCSFRFVFIWFAFFLDWHFFHISSSLLVSKSTWFQCPRLDTCPIKYLLENQMCRVIQELFQRWHVHRLKEQFDVSHARFDLEDDFFC